MSDFILEKKNPANNTWEVKKFITMEEVVSEILKANGGAIKDGENSVFIIIFAIPNSDIYKLSEEFICQLKKKLNGNENNGFVSFEGFSQEKNIRIVYESNSKDDYSDDIIKAIVRSSLTGAVKALLINNKQLSEMLSDNNNLNGVNNAVFIFPQNGPAVSNSVESTVMSLVEALGKQISVYKYRNEDQFKRQQVQYEKLSLKSNYLGKEKNDINQIVRSLYKENLNEFVKQFDTQISKIVNKMLNDDELDEVSDHFTERSD